MMSEKREQEAWDVAREVVANGLAFTAAVEAVRSLARVVLSVDARLSAVEKGLARVEAYAQNTQADVSALAEAQVDRDIAEGRTKKFDTIEDAMAWLRENPHPEAFGPDYLTESERASGWVHPTNPPTPVSSPAPSHSETESRVEEGEEVRVGPLVDDCGEILEGDWTCEGSAGHEGPHYVLRNPLKGQKSYHAALLIHRREQEEPETRGGDPNATAHAAVCRGSVAVPASGAPGEQLDAEAQAVEPSAVDVPAESQSAPRPSSPTPLSVPREQAVQGGGLPELFVIFHRSGRHPAPIAPWEHHDLAEGSALEADNRYPSLGPHRVVRYAPSSPAQEPKESSVPREKDEPMKKCLQLDCPVCGGRLGSPATPSPEGVREANAEAERLRSVLGSPSTEPDGQERERLAAFKVLLKRARQFGGTGLDEVFPDIEAAYSQALRGSAQREQQEAVAWMLTCQIGTGEWEPWSCHLTKDEAMLEAEVVANPGEYRVDPLYRSSVRSEPLEEREAVEGKAVAWRVDPAPDDPGDEPPWFYDDEGLAEEVASVVPGRRLVALSECSLVPSTPTGEGEKP